MHKTASCIFRVIALASLATGSVANKPLLASPSSCSVSHREPTKIKTQRFLLLINGHKRNRLLLKFINPEDIDSIRIIKPDAAIARYGRRDSDGAIFIVTKKGRK